MGYSHWKRGLAAVVAAFSLSGAALAQSGLSVVEQQTIQPVLQQPGVSADQLAQNPQHKDNAVQSPFQEETAPAPAPTSENQSDPSSAKTTVTVTEPQGAAGGTPTGQTDPAYPADEAASPAPPPPQPWRVPQPRVLENAGITMGGWLQQGITFSGDVPADRFNGPIATNDRHAEWQMNQLWLFFNKPIDNDGEGWDLGGRLDMIYGSDARFGVNWGLENRINGENQPYGLVIPQLYAEVAYNKLSVKLGHFAGILSYEQVPAVANFFYSHSYAMYFTEPLLVTGVLADYKVTDQWSILAGFHRGWMMWEDLNDELDFTGGVQWTSLEKKTSIRYTVDVGPQDPVHTNQNRFASSLLIQHQLSEKLQYVLQNNLGVENNGDPRTDADAPWYGINQYLFYTINPEWKAGMRVEWLCDETGLFYGPGNVPGNGRAWDGGPGFAGDWFEISWGLNWRPNPNMVIRPELRYDTYNGTRDLKGNFPFDDGHKTYQMTVAADMIIMF